MPHFVISVSLNKQMVCFYCVLVFRTICLRDIVTMTGTAESKCCAKSSRTQQHVECDCCNAEGQLPLRSDCIFLKIIIIINHTRLRKQNEMRESPKKLCLARREMLMCNGDARRLFPLDRGSHHGFSHEVFYS